MPASFSCRNPELWPGEDLPSAVPTRFLQNIPCSARKHQEVVTGDQLAEEGRIPLPGLCARPLPCTSVWPPLPPHTGTKPCFVHPRLLARASGRQPGKLALGLPWPLTLSFLRSLTGHPTSSPGSHNTRVSSRAGMNHSLAPLLKHLQCLPLSPEQVQRLHPGIHCHLWYNPNPCSSPHRTHTEMNYTRIRTYISGSEYRVTVAGS